MLKEEKGKDGGVVLAGRKFFVEQGSNLHSQVLDHGKSAHGETKQSDVVFDHGVAMFWAEQGPDIEESTHRLCRARLVNFKTDLLDKICRGELVEEEVHESQKVVEMENVHSVCDREGFLVELAVEEEGLAEWILK